MVACGTGFLQTRRGPTGKPQAYFGSRFSPWHSLGKNPNHTPGKVSLPVSPARLAAFRILLRVQREESYASELLHSSLTDSLQENDLRLATELVFGTLRQQRLLDHLLASCSAKALTKLDAEVLAALRLGAYQILFLQRVPGRAAVHESVELVKSARLKSAAGFVNAVLRKVASSDLEKTRKAFDEPTASALSVRYSHPEWLVERWLARFGQEKVSPAA